jgi:2-C-methyl-D-erythritol 4-phosphate cytidylyltransferase
VGVPVRDTIKRVCAEADALVVTETLDRQSLWRAQTPQAFRREALLTAHQAVSPHAAVTDDVQLLELTGHRGVVTVLGSERNLKITTLEDLALAAAWLAMGNLPSDTP